MEKREIKELFNNTHIIQKIQEKAPNLFQLAELDNSRNGKLGMEIGSARERILIALLIKFFGSENVSTDTPITESATDVFISGIPLSIKSFTNKNIVGVKLIWTVDSEKAREFIDNHDPECDILLAHIFWNGNGGLYLIKKEDQKELLNKIGKNVYFKLPKQGTNPRGVEISTKALRELCQKESTKKISIFWNRDNNLKFDPYEKWVELWDS